jgi:hypothetical protein
MSASGSYQQAKSNSNNQAQMNQNVFGPQASALSGLYNSAQGVLANNQQYANQAMPVAQQNAQNVVSSALPAWQQQLQGVVYGGLGIGNQLMSSLQQSQNTPSATSQIYADMMGGNGNNYADAMKASYIGDANRAADAMNRTLDARATGDGMNGGSRQGIAQAQGYYDINSNLQHNLAQTGYNTFDKDLNNKLMIAQQADQGNLSRQQLMAGMLGQQNGAQTGALNFGEGMQNLGLGTLAPSTAGWANINGLGSLIGQPTVLSNGSSFGNSNAKSKGSSTSASI